MMMMIMMMMMMLWWCFDALMVSSNLDLGTNFPNQLYKRTSNQWTPLKCENSRRPWLYKVSTEKNLHHRFLSIRLLKKTWIPIGPKKHPGIRIWWLSIFCWLFKKGVSKPQFVRPPSISFISLGTSFSFNKNVEEDQGTAMGLGRA